MDASGDTILVLWSVGLSSVSFNFLFVDSLASCGFFNVSAVKKNDFFGVANKLALE